MPSGPTLRARSNASADCRRDRCSAPDAFACDEAVRRVQAGDMDSFRVIYVAYSTDVYRHVHRVLKNEHDALDVTQQVFTQALESVATFPLGSKPLAPWLFAIARNAAIDHIRKSAWTDVEPSDVIDGCRSAPAQASESRILDSEVGIYVAALPPRQRAIVVLRGLLDLSATETGAALGCSADSVRHVQQRALRSLRKKLLSAS
jgi:RNA polymerase sigma-70 factor, ECF subfamily